MMVTVLRRHWLVGNRLALYGGGLAAICLVCCGDGGMENRISLRQAQESHRQMIEALEVERVRSADMHPYLGQREAQRLRNQLSILPGDAPVKIRSQLHFRLGIAELFLGNERQAIDQLDRSHQLFFQAGGSQRAAREHSFRLGLAWLRLGETENCVLNHGAESCILPIRANGVHTLKEGSRRAIPYFQAVLDNTVADEALHLSARWLLNIAHMTLGEYPDRVSPAHLIEPEVFESAVAFPRFANIAPALGLDTFSLSGGAVADDFNNDGYLDLVVSTWDTGGAVRFFINKGDGTFAERTEEANLRGLYGGLNLVQADYDNDGHLDLLVLRGAWAGIDGRHPNSLLRNQGDETFLDLTFAAGLGLDHYPTQTAAWADYDLDGDLDLFIGNESTEELVAPCQLFQNQGDGTFRDTAQEAGVTNYGFAKAAIWGDYDGDRWPDLYVSNLGQPNRLYRNRGDGKFEDLAPQLEVADPQASFPAWFWDYDNDGILDLFVAAYAATVADIAASYLDLPVQVELARLYRGDGHGGFSDMAPTSNLVQPTAPMGCNFGDLDGDGFMDFYLGTGDVNYENLMPNMLYWNQKGQHFADVTFASGLAHLQKGHAVVFADFDNDGDLDIFEQMGGAYRGDGYPDAFYANPGFGHHWLAVEIEGTRSNRSGIGVRLRVDIKEGAQQRSLYRWVGSGGSFGGNPLRQFFGLGAAERVIRLTVYWPLNDIEQVFEGLPMDVVVRVREGASQIERLDLPIFEFAELHMEKTGHKSLD